MSLYRVRVKCEGKLLAAPLIEAPDESAALLKAKVLYGDVSATLRAEKSYWLLNGVRWHYRVTEEVI